ncbi:hypothetical protein [Tenacibaculum maritimum]|uniref:hypothetical protein n=1 Tax=Tenacibaculum maritimum TaxID=107401 RepID=UPI001330F42B|nr:hypothetical protein [Tenacibaculum maritimum]
MSENKKKINDSKKEPKKTNNKDYQEKLNINASFDEILGMLETSAGDTGFLWEIIYYFVKSLVLKRILKLFLRLERVFGC